MLENFMRNAMTWWKLWRCLSKGARRRPWRWLSGGMLAHEPEKERTWSCPLLSAWTMVHTHVLSPHTNEIIIIVKIIFKELRRNRDGEGRRWIHSRNQSRKQSQPRIPSARGCARDRRILLCLPECCCALASFRSPAQSGCTAAEAALCAFDSSVHLFHNPTPQQCKQSSAIWQEFHVTPQS